jgi:hypothetical protein
LVVRTGSPQIRAGSRARGTFSPIVVVVAADDFVVVVVVGVDENSIIIVH